MFTGLNTAIHQFSKRQMTWFRRMDRMGTQIYWFDGNLSDNIKLGKIKEWMGERLLSE
jgi:tRNA dimethylallyltransferase